MMQLQTLFQATSEKEQEQHPMVQVNNNAYNHPEYEHQNDHIQIPCLRR